MFYICIGHSIFWEARVFWSISNQFPVFAKGTIDQTPPWHEALPYQPSPECDVPVGKPGFRWVGDEGKLRSRQTNAFLLGGFFVVVFVVWGGCISICMIKIRPGLTINSH